MDENPRSARDHAHAASSSRAESGAAEPREPLFDAKAFGARLKGAMDVGRWSCRKLATAIGVSAPTINRVSRGEEPTVEHYLRIKAWLDLSAPDPQVSPPFRADLKSDLGELVTALEEIKNLKAVPIGDTGFQVGPLALLQAAQRIARTALARFRGASS